MAFLVLYNLTIILPAWILFIGFCNISVNLGVTIFGLLQLSNYFSAFRCSWITSSKIITISLLFILTSYNELCFENPIQLLLVSTGDLRINLGPKSKNQISFHHWNLNGLAVHNFSLLQTLSIPHGHDIICLLEIFLNWSAFKKRWKSWYYRLKSSTAQPSKQPKVGKCLHVLRGTPSYYWKRWFKKPWRNV